MLVHNDDCISYETFYDWLICLPEENWEELIRWTEAAISECRLGEQLNSFIAIVIARKLINTDILKDDIKNYISQILFANDIKAQFPDDDEESIHHYIHNYGDIDDLIISINRIFHSLNNSSKISSPFFTCLDTIYSIAQNIRNKNLQNVLIIHFNDLANNDADFEKYLNKIKFLWM